MSQEPSSSALLRKIRALLEKADVSRGATDAEAAASMAKAQELMTKYGIEQMDVTASTPSSGPTFDIAHEQYVTTRKLRYDYDANVARIIQKCFGVKIIWTSAVGPDGKRKHVYSLVGDRTDIAMAKIAITLCLKAMTSGVARYLREECRGAKWTAPVGRAYYLGVERGYLEASEQGRKTAYQQATKQQADRYAIVLVDKEKAVANAVPRFFPALRSTKSRGPRDGYSDRAYQAGQRDGSHMDLLSGNKLE